MSPEEAQGLACLAIGRILRMGSRPSQPGDVEEYYRCRDIVMDAVEVLGIRPKDHQISYTRDYRKGAQGD